MISRDLLIVFFLVVISILSCGCSNGDVERLKNEKIMLEQDLKAKSERVVSLEAEIKKLNDNNSKLTEESSNLRRRLTDAGLAENPDEAAFNGCKENLKKIALGLRLYSADHGKKYPKKLSDISPNPNYLEFVPTCPAAAKDTYTLGYKASKDAKGYKVCCFGHNHGAILVKKDYPRFDSVNGLEVERDDKKAQAEEE